MALSILAAHFGIEQFRKFKAILTKRICELDQISLFNITVGCVFVISVFVNMFCWDRKLCKPSNSVLSPIPLSGRLPKCKTPGRSENMHLESVSTTTRDFPCRRTFSGQGTDVWHDFRRYFENISQLRIGHVSTLEEHSCAVFEARRRHLFMAYLQVSKVISSYYLLG